MHLPPIVALFLTVAFVVFLFRRDFREEPNVTGALWLPLLWMLLTCSRSVSEWLTVFGLPGHGASTLEQGSPLDAWFYFGLIAAGIYVLNKRQVQLSEIFRNNGWLIAFLLYCFIAILWSDFPFVALKRWIKILGHPIMALILLTEPDPEEAIVRLMKRCAYIIVPVSILFIKYYPEWGRGFDDWTGQPLNTGIATGKNALGCDCFILGLFFFWHLLQTWRSERSRAKRKELFLITGFLVAIWWLLSQAASSTALVSLLLAVLIVALLGQPLVNKRMIGTYLVVVIVIYVLADATLGVSGRVIELLGKSPTLTDRTIIWHEVLQVPINPFFGAGFESFWLGDRLKLFAGKHWWQPNQAHNGYLETYLNLGLVGVFILTGLLIATFRKIRLELLKNFEIGRLRLGFLVAIVLFNWTEATFKTLHPVWFVFYIIAMDYPRSQLRPAQPLAFEGFEEERELAYTEFREGSEGI